MSASNSFTSWLTNNRVSQWLWNNVVKDSSADNRVTASAYIECFDHGRYLGLSSADLYQCAKSGTLMCQLEEKKFIEEWQKAHKGQEYTSSLLKENNSELFHKLYYEDGSAKHPFVLSLVPVPLTDEGLQKFDKYVGRELVARKNAGHVLPQQVWKLPYKENYFRKLCEKENFKCGFVGDRAINIPNFGDRAPWEDNLVHYLVDYWAGRAVAFIAGLSVALSFGFATPIAALTGIGAALGVFAVEYFSNMDGYWGLAEKLLRFKYLFSKDHKWFSEKGVGFRTGTWRDLAHTLWKGAKSLFILGAGIAMLTAQVFLPALASMKALSIISIVLGIPTLLGGISGLIGNFDSWHYFNGFGFTNTQIDISDAELAKISAVKDVKRPSKAELNDRLSEKEAELADLRSRFAQGPDKALIMSKMHQSQDVGSQEQQAEGVDAQPVTRATM